MQLDHPKPTRAQRLRRINWPFLLFLVALVVWLTGCSDARSTDPGPAIETVVPDSGPMIDFNSPRFVVQQDGLDMSDGHGGILQYRDPVVAGVILERLAVADPRRLYSIDQRGGHWGVSYDSADPDGVLLEPGDVRVQQQDSSGLAINAALEAGPAVFQLATEDDVEWYLDGALVAEGATATIDLEEGDHLLSVIVWTDNGSQSVELPLYVAPRLAQVLMQWDIPQARENGAALPVTELCCYQVTWITGNTLGLVDVDGGATTQLALELPAGLYRFSIVAIDTEGLTSAPSDSVEADLTRGRTT